MNRFVLLFMLVLAVPGLAQTPTEWVERLNGENPSAAADALTALEPEASLPPLLQCLKAAEAEHAWRASKVLLRIAKEKPEAKAWKEIAAGLLRATQDEGAALHNRMISGLSIRGLGKAAKKAVSPLVDSLTEDQPREVRLCNTIGLAGLGKIAGKDLAKQLRGEGLLRLFWSTTALALMGEEGKSTKNVLVRLVEDKKRISAFMTCRSGHFALKRTSGERVADKSLEKRSKNEEGKLWTKGYGRINFGAPCPVKMEAFFSYLSTTVKGFRRPNIDKLSLPEYFAPAFSGGSLNLGDALSSITLHLTKEINGIYEEIGAETFKDWAELKARLDPVAETVRFLEYWDPETRPQ